MPESPTWTTSYKYKKTIHMKMLHNYGFKNKDVIYISRKNTFIYSDR